MMTLFPRRIIERLERLNPDHPGPKAPIGISLNAVTKFCVVGSMGSIAFFSTGIMSWTATIAALLIGLILLRRAWYNNFPAWRRFYWRIRHAYAFLAPVERRLAELQNRSWSNELPIVRILQIIDPRFEYDALLETVEDWKQHFQSSHFDTLLMKVAHRLGHDEQRSIQLVSDLRRQIQEHAELYDAFLLRWLIGEIVNVYTGEEQQVALWIAIATRQA